MKESNYHIELHKQLRDKLLVTSRRNRMVYYKEKAFSLNLSKLSNNNKISNNVMGWVESQKILSSFNLDTVAKAEHREEFNKTVSSLRRESNKKLTHFSMSNQSVCICFLNWKRSDRGTTHEVRSPLLTCSTSLEKGRGKNGHYELSFDDRKFKVNPFIIHILKTEFGITLPSFVDPNKESIVKFFNILDGQLARIDKMVSITSSDVLSDELWTLDFSQAIIDDISFPNESLIAEYDYMLNDPCFSADDSAESFSKLFSLKPKNMIGKQDVATFYSQYMVVPSDATQTKAIQYARKGESYIVQGPPGTGKSQTITNLIADFVVRGKKVLFVCEKQAALEVVDNKLKNVGLGDLSFLVTDSCADKKSFIKSLKSVYSKCLDYEFDNTPDIERKQLATRLDIESDEETLSEFIDSNSKFITNQFYRRINHILSSGNFDKARKVIEHEISKKRNYKSIMAMFNGYSGELVSELKPIMLMNVDSISENFGVDYEQFDVVIFDEASQIRLEDCAPIAYKASQMIIVGDEQQLAPTSFFMKKSDSDDELLVDINGSDINLNLYSENLLEQANTLMPSVMLKYHYRSQHGNLIEFSNKHFYNGELVTVASQISDGGIGFHHIEDGIYEDRKNNDEAKYIAEQLKDILMSDSDNSVGVVAFSEAQKVEIQNEIDILCGEDQEFSTKYYEESQKSFEPLFIKNLENVQGDERDTMIISICYGYNDEGKMRMNFGPINKEGGGNRLNVVFSRSKKNMMIVSSIKHHDIDSSNEGALLLKDFLNYAENVSEIA